MQKRYVQIYQQLKQFLEDDVIPDTHNLSVDSETAEACF